MPQIRGEQIADESVTSADIKDGTITGADIADNAISASKVDIRYKEAVAAVANLPAVSNTVGDVRLVSDVKALYTWTGTAWVVVSPSARVAEFKLSAPYSHAGGVWEVIPLNVTVFNKIGGTISSGILTPGIAGYYRFSAGGYTTTTGSAWGQRYAIGVYVNGNNRGFGGGSFSVTDTPLEITTKIVYLSATDYISTAMFSIIPCTLPAQNTTHHDFWMNLEYIGQ